MPFDPKGWAALVWPLVALVAIGFAWYVYTKPETQKVSVDVKTGAISVEKGKQGAIDPTATIYAPDTGVPRPGNPGTVWISNCPRGTKVISGYCIVQKSKSGRPVYLQNIGTTPGQEQWHCVWSEPVEKADVRALCLPSK